ncbi:hypothetical protein Sjap_020166 [Stephania japonica]|uniref:Uncharacterized protein n=1 Tax=Stephania japonica TaxID=461633 RepID=A0AAP0HYS6_9MAGN
MTSTNSPNTVLEAEAGVKTAPWSKLGESGKEQVDLVVEGVKGGVELKDLRWVRRGEELCRHYSSAFKRGSKQNRGCSVFTLFLAKKLPLFVLENCVEKSLSSLLDGSEPKLGFPNLMLGNVWFASKTGGTRLKETLKGEVLLSQDCIGRLIASAPEAWIDVFLSHPALGDLLNDEDQKIFKFLSSLEVEDFKDVKSGNNKDNEHNNQVEGGKDLANGVNHDKKGSKRPFSDESFLSWFSETQQKDLAEGFHDEVASYAAISF